MRSNQLAPTREQIELGLSRIRFRRRLSHLPFAIFFATGLLSGLLGLIVPSAIHDLWQNTLFKFLIAPFAFGSITALVVPVLGLKCPRCGNYFHAGQRYRNDFTRKCLNCGLRLDGGNIDERVVNGSGSVADYSSIDPVINAWVERHGFSLYTLYAGGPESRNVYVSGNGECCQIWIDPPESGRVALHAADVETRSDEEMRQDWHVPVQDLEQTLEEALAFVQQWMRRND